MQVVVARGGANALLAECGKCEPGEDGQWPRNQATQVAEFMVHARTALPAALDEIERLQKLEVT